MVENELLRGRQVVSDDHFRFRDLPGPAWHAATRARPEPDRSGWDSRHNRFQDQLDAVNFLAPETKVVASALYDWEAIQALGVDDYVYPVSLVKMSQAVELPTDVVRRALADLQHCRAIKLTDEDSDSPGVTLEAIYFWPSTWTALARNERATE